jgi:hypothetical protein
MLLANIYEDTEELKKLSSTDLLRLRSIVRDVKTTDGASVPTGLPSVDTSWPRPGYACSSAADNKTNDSASVPTGLPPAHYTSCPRPDYAFSSAETTSVVESKQFKRFSWPPEFRDSIVQYVHNANKSQRHVNTVLRTFRDDIKRVFPTMSEAEIKPKLQKLLANIIRLQKKQDANQSQGTCQFVVRFSRILRQATPLLRQHKQGS